MTDRKPNKAIKWTAFPSLFLWFNATLPQNNQLQSRNLWRRYALKSTKYRLLTKLIKFKIIVLLSSIFLSMNVSAKTYFCGASGTLLESSEPCKMPETDWSIKPVISDSLNKEVIDRTVKMLRAATIKRDITAIERLLSDNFTFQSNDNSWSGKVLFSTDKNGFITLITEHLLAMTSYEQVVEHYSVKIINGGLVAETVSYEKISLGEKNIEAKLLERINLEVVGNKVTIQSIKQIEL